MMNVYTAERENILEAYNIVNVHTEIEYTTQHTPEVDYVTTEGVGNFTTGVVSIGARPRSGRRSLCQLVGPSGMVKMSATILNVDRCKSSILSNFHACSSTRYLISICLDRSKHPRWPVIVLMKGSLSI